MARPSRAARPTRPLRDISDDDDNEDDEFPDIAVLVQRKLESRETEKTAKFQDSDDCSQQNADKAPQQPAASVRRRRLAPIANNNALLGAWNPDSPTAAGGKGDKPRRKKEGWAPRVELRTKSTKSAISVRLSSTKTNLEQTDVAEEEEITIIEEVSVMHDDNDDDDSDDVFQSAESNASNFEEEEDDDDDTDDSLTEFFARNARPKNFQLGAEKDLVNSWPTNHDRARTARKGRQPKKATALVDLTGESGRTKSTGDVQDSVRQRPGVSAGKDLTDTFSRLNL